MYKAIVYKIEGPRSLFEAVNVFNTKDHSSALYNNKSGISVYVKHQLGKDFAITTLSDRSGVKESEQILDEKQNIHIPLNNKAVGKKFNAVLIVDESDGLIRAEKLIGLDTIEIDNSPYINICNWKLK